MNHIAQHFVIKRSSGARVAIWVLILSIFGFSAGRALTPIADDSGVEFDGARLDTRPGDDFYRYANGKWYDSFRLPDDTSSYDYSDRLGELTERRLREILEQASGTSSDPRSSELRQLGNLYASFMDQAFIESQSLRPLEPGLASISAAGSKADIARIFGETGFTSPFSARVLPDPMQPARYVVAIQQSGLGLPNRDYYLRAEKEFRDLRRSYMSYVETVLTLTGEKRAKRNARDIVEFETAIAKAQWSRERQRDVSATYYPLDQQRLLMYAPGFSWGQYLGALHIPSQQRLDLRQRTAIRGAAAVIRATSIHTLKEYLRFHYVSDLADYLPERFATAAFDFYGRTIDGQPTPRDRWKRGVALVNVTLGDLIGRIYVERFFSPRSKQLVEDIGEHLRTAMKQRLDQATWLTPETRERAKAKLARLAIDVGYPAKWRDYSNVRVERYDLVGNILRARESAWASQIAGLATLVDRQEWRMPPQEINGFYDNEFNRVAVPAGILQPPVFDEQADPAANYGAIGAVLAHEITHGFDDQGRRFGPEGQLEDWWKTEDSSAFANKVQLLADQYSSYEALPGLHINGAATVNENIADLGGVNISFAAYRLSLNGAVAPSIAGLSGEQRFFLAYAQTWRAKSRIAELRREVATWVHSPPYFRVNGTLRNVDAWYAAFSVDAHDRWYLAPSERIVLW